MGLERSHFFLFFVVIVVVTTFIIAIITAVIVNYISLTEARSTVTETARDSTGSK